MSDSVTADLIDACGKPGCPVCRLSLAATHRYLDGVLHEYVNDSGVREGLRAARGYCNEHAWWLSEGHGNALGVAMLYKDVMDEVLEQIGRPTGQRNAGDGGNGLLGVLRHEGRRQAADMLAGIQATAGCPACAHRRAVEERIYEVLSQHVTDAALWAALQGSAGLCLLHFAGTLAAIDSADALDRLLSLQRDALAGLQHELGEFIRKSDYRFQAEGFEQEGDSWRRALGTISGQRGVR